MPERPPPSSEAPASDDWPLEQLATQLDAEREPVSDPAFGPGERLLVGPDDALALELYPASGALRLTSGHSRIELFQQAVPSLQDDLLLFSRDHGDEEVQLAVDRQGTIALRVLPYAASEAIQEAISASLDAPMDQVAETDESVDSGPSSSLEDDDSTAVEGTDQQLPADVHERNTETDEEQEPQPRLTITGRLGRNPHFRTTRNGVTVASFPVAVLEDDGSTSWHRVVAFRERAERLRDQLKSGDRVEVIGYLHERERQTRDGSSRIVEELYAAVIKPR